MERAAYAKSPTDSQATRAAAEEQSRQPLATGEPRGIVRHTPESPLAGERIAARRNASASRGLAGVTGSSRSASLIGIVAD